MAGKLLAVLQRLRRPTGSGRLIPEIDGLRFFAIGLVVLHHESAYFTAYGVYSGVSHAAALGHVWLFDFGKRGVELFFVISGFIVSLPFAREAFAGRRRVHRGLYYWRRVIRIEPPYLVNLLLVALLLHWVKQAPWADLWDRLLPHLIYGTAILGTEPLNGVTWSLEVEFQFYVLAPLIVLVFRIRRFASRCAVVVLLAGVAHGWARQSMPQVASLLLYGLYFVAGLILADWYVRTENSGSRVPGTVLDWVGLLAWPAAWWISNHGIYTGWILPFLWSVVVMASLRGRLTPKLMANPVLAGIGGMCYTIYLYHYFVISGMGRLTVEWFSGLSYPLFFALQLGMHSLGILVVSSILYLAIERPFMELSSRLVRLRANRPIKG